MPHMPDSQHETHDLELVAAFAAGDAEGPALDRALALVAECSTCAELHRDLRSIASAMPSVPAPARPRDFRLTREQAASLRPAGLRGLVAALSGPRFSFAVPLGSGLAALGIVAVLAAPGSGGFASAPVPQEDAATRVTQEAASPPVDTLNAAGAEPASAAPVLEAPAGALPAEGQPAAEGLASPGTESLKAGGTTAAAPDEQAPGDSLTTTASAPDPVVVAGLLLVLLGVALVGARLLSRGLARAP
ncbi:MAG TPA: hypothetical protein VFY23_09200 [Candidatus Limnocylindrales bacterium]|nr:hypothetical protein [Candidatus Limnocylindrales bacterium]